MPQVSAAVFRSMPSSTSASASIRRAACASRLLAAAARSSAAVKSIRVIAIATICSDLLPLGQRVRDRAIWESPSGSRAERPLV